MIKLKVKLFDKNVEVKDTSCGMNGNKGYPYIDLRINVYTCLTHVCNAKCPFCEYHYNDTYLFDFEKWRYCIDEIVDTLGIFKASFTGGEPSLELETLKKCLKYLKNKDENIFTIINTNGVRLKDLEGIDELDNIALSRHALSDEENYKIFGTDTVSSLQDIIDFKDKSKIHLSCNIIKGYIDSDEKIKEYFEMASEVGVLDVGFVTLMPINKYAEEHSIDFSDISLSLNNKFIINRYFDRVVNNSCVCKCRNYLYNSQNGKIITGYSRYYIDRNYTDGALVYMDNKLRQGFTGEVIK